MAEDAFHIDESDVFARPGEESGFGVLSEQEKADALAQLEELRPDTVRELALQVFNETSSLGLAFAAAAALMQSLQSDEDFFEVEL